MQQQVQQAIDQLVAADAERGLQVAVYRDGTQVVDAVAGVADPATGRPVTSGTVFYAYSTGKIATATVVHVLAERGLFGYDTPVADLWPEFGAHGKEGVTIRHVLTHSAGVPGVPSDTTRERMCDWDWVCGRIAASTLWWEPGTATGYHAHTFGYILGEVVRRATGRPISQVLREEVAAPLGVADELYFGMPVSEHGRLATLEDGPGAAEAFASIPDDSPMFATGPRETWPDAAFGNRTDILEADLPQGGKMSARAMARVLAALIGEVDGVRLLSPERLRTVTAVALRGTDQLMGTPATLGLGYSLGWLSGEPADPPTMFGFGGVGGSYAFADTATGTTFTLTKNRLTVDFSAAQQVGELVLEATGR